MAQVQDASADPAYAARLGLVPAPLDRRTVAGAIDAVLLLLLQLPWLVFTLPLLLKLLTGRISAYGFLHHPRFTLAMAMLGLSVLTSLVLVVAQLSFHGRKGVTVGKSMTGIRTVNVSSLEAPGFGRVAVRALIVWASTIVVIGPVLFLLSPRFDRQGRGRGWHDEIGETWLVDVREGRDPYDVKGMRMARRAVEVEIPVAQAKPLPSLATAVGAPAEQAYRPGGRISAGVLGVAPVEHVTPLDSVLLHLDTGETIEVREPVVLGREPGAMDGARPVAITDDSHSVSKTHLLLQPTDTGLTIVDQRSTNGTVLVHEGVPFALVAGQPAGVVPGDEIRFGDRVARVARA